MGDLNLLGWVILRSDNRFNKVLNEPLAKLCAVESKGYWERLVNTDEKRKIFFPSDFQGNRFKRDFDIPFYLLEYKIKYDFSVAMSYLSKYYGFSLLAFKLYRPNLITNDGYINHYQKIHRDFKITFPKMIIKLKTSSTTKKTGTSSDKKKKS